MMKLNCPQCGLALDSFANTKLSSCPSCDSSLLIENDIISLSDLNVAKNTEKSLFAIDNIVRIKNRDYTPRGYSLYQYDLHDKSVGRRVEWELSDDQGNTVFLNQEDENLFLVKQISQLEQTLPSWESLQPNTMLKGGGCGTSFSSEWLVVEQLQVTFNSYYGALKNLPTPNKKLKCTYLSNTQGECLVLTFSNNSHKAYQGWWLDPMDLA